MNTTTSLSPAPAKDCVLKKLKEESGILVEALRLILFCYAAWLVIVTAALAGILIFQAPAAELLRHGSEADGLTRILAQALEYYTDGRALNAQGGLNLFAVIFFGAAQIINTFISFFIFRSIYGIFKNILSGVPPFSAENARWRKKCARIYAVLLVLSFLSAFALRLMVSSIISPILGYCFFTALGLIFEYGNYLQTESDETL